MLVKLIFMKRAIREIRTGVILVCTILSCKNTPAPDLVNIQFNERADQFLKGVAADPESRSDKSIRYDIKDVKQLPFQGLTMDSYIKVGAQNGIISYYSAETKKTATTISLLVAMKKKYGQPTVVLRNEQDDKALYWLIPGIYARYMQGGIVHKGRNGLSAFIEIASVKALNNGASPGMLDNYNMVKRWNSPEAKKERDDAVTNGPVPPGKSLEHTIRPN